MKSNKFQSLKLKQFGSFEIKNGSAITGGLSHWTSTSSDGSRDWGTDCCYWSDRRCGFETSFTSHTGKKVGTGSDAARTCECNP